MITSWDIYWITRLDGILSFITTVQIVFIIIFTALATFAPFWLDEDFVGWEKISKFYSGHKFIFHATILFILCLSILNPLIPSTKEAVAIYAMPKVINNEKVQEIPDNALDFINTNHGS